MTTTFAGNNNDSSRLTTLSGMYLNDDPAVMFADLDLFPDKILNLQGREIVLSLFNYMPYVLWKEVVSNKETAAVVKKPQFHLLQNETDDEFNSREKLLRTPLHIDGTESWVFLEFCKKLNCSLLMSLGKEKSNFFTSRCKLIAGH